MITRLLRITGRVQGVGYREAMRREAATLAVAGWVRNRIDGTVEALVHGEPAAVAALIAWARVGPRGARVEDVIVEDSPPAQEKVPAGFDVRPTI